MKRLEDKLRKEGPANISLQEIHCSQSTSGKPVTHPDAEDHLAAFASDEVDKLAEKGRMLLNMEISLI